MAEVHSFDRSCHSDRHGGVQVSRMFWNRDDVSLLSFLHCRNADNGFYDDELAECVGQRRNVMMRRERNA